MMDKAREQIDASGADIAGLQEVDRDGSGRAGDKMISTLTSGAMNNYFFAPTMSYFFGEDYGIMTTTRHEMAGSFSLFLPFPYEHLSLSNAQIEPRVVTRTLITIDGVQVAAYNTHLDYTGETMPDGTLLRRAQMQFVYELMLTDPCPYQILTGDFNAGGWDDFSVFMSSDKYALSSTPENPIASFFTDGDKNKPAYIDNIIYSKNSLQLIEAFNTESDLSDHLMLTAKFKTIN